MNKNLAIILAALIVAVSAHAEKTTVSVMDLKVTSGVATLEVQQLTNKLMNELVICDAFAVVDRAKRDEILKEQGFQMTGACDQGSCLVQVGQLLGVQKMIGGSIGRVGRVYSVEIQLVDVRTGAIDLAFSREYQGDVSQLLGAMREAAQELSSWGVRPKVEITPEQPEFGIIRVKSKPKGAVIALDGQYLGMTPAKLSKVEAGEHRLTLSKQGCLLYSTAVTVTTDQTILIDAILEPESTTEAAAKPTPVRRTVPVAPLIPDVVTGKTDTLGISGLAAYYPFEGNSYDESGNNRHGAPNGVSPAKDRFGTPGFAYAFDGRSSYVQLPSADELSLRNGSFTVSVWVNGTDFESDAQDHSILGMDYPANSGCLTLLVRHQKPLLAFYSNDTYADLRVRSGAWYHLVFRYNGWLREQAIFINGTLDVTSLGHSPMNGDGGLTVGRWCRNRYFMGTIDDIRIYDRVLNDDEVKRLYHEGGWGK